MIKAIYHFRKKPSKGWQAIQGPILAAPSWSYFQGSLNIAAHHFNSAGHRNTTFSNVSYCERDGNSVSNSEHHLWKHRWQEDSENAEAEGRKPALLLSHKGELASLLQAQPQRHYGGHKQNKIRKNSDTDVNVHCLKKKKKKLAQPITDEPSSSCLFPPLNLTEAKTVRRDYISQFPTFRDEKSVQNSEVRDLTTSGLISRPPKS